MRVCYCLAHVTSLLLFQNLLQIRAWIDLGAPSCRSHLGVQALQGNCSVILCPPRVAAACKRRAAQARRSSWHAWYVATSHNILRGVW